MRLGVIRLSFGVESGSTCMSGSEAQMGLAEGGQGAGRLLIGSLFFSSNARVAI